MSVIDGWNTSSPGDESNLSFTVVRKGARLEIFDSSVLERVATELSKIAANIRGRETIRDIQIFSVPASGLMVDFSSLDKGLTAEAVYRNVGTTNLDVFIKKADGNLTTSAVRIAPNAKIKMVGHSGFNAFPDSGTGFLEVTEIE